MWTLKDPVKIVAKVAGQRLIIDRESLHHDQNLYEIIKTDPVAWARYGHNFVEGAYSPKTKPKEKQAKEQKLDIEVNIKKKPELPSEPSKVSASTLTEAPTGGMTLNVSEAKPASKSSDSTQENPQREKRGYQKRK